MIFTGIISVDPSILLGQLNPFSGKKGQEMRRCHVCHENSHFGSNSLVKVSPNDSHFVPQSKVSDAP